ncbi:MAG: MFS transporter [Anaerolineae bacterium]|nr:MFS transporter [Anaerolineae bacterium]
MTSSKNVWILSATLVIIMLGYGMVQPLFPFLVKQFGASGKDLGLLISAYAVMQLIFAPLWGGLSDRVGRKPILAIGILGYSLAMLLFGLSTEWWMLFLSRTLSGILSSATLPTAMAYISDSTSEKERGSSMGILGAAMAVGVILGPGIGGWLARVSLSTPFFLGSGIAFLSFLSVWIWLPESLLPELRRTTQDKPPIFQLTYWREALRGPLAGLLLLTLMVSFGMTNFQGIFGLYALQRYGYGSEQIGGIFMILGCAMLLAQGVLTGVLIKRLGEVAVIRLSLIVTVVGFLLMTLATTYLTVLLTTSIFILAIALLGPALNALISERTSMPQGITMGLANVFTSLGRIVGPIWAGYVFDLNINYPYFSGAAIVFVGFLVSFIGVSRDVGDAKSPRPI